MKNCNSCCISYFDKVCPLCAARNEIIKLENELRSADIELQKLSVELEGRDAS